MKINKRALILLSLFVILLASYFAFYSERGDIIYTALDPEEANITPNTSHITPNQEIQIEFETYSDKRVKSALRPLLRSELIVSTSLNNPDSYIIIEKSGEKKFASKVESKTYQDSEYKSFYFEVPKQENKTLKVHLEGKVPEEKSEIGLAHLVNRNYYLFGQKEYYLNSIKNPIEGIDTDNCVMKEGDEKAVCCFFNNSMRFCSNEKEFHENETIIAKLYIGKLAEKAGIDPYQMCVVNNLERTKEAYNTSNKVPCLPPKELGEELFVIFQGKVKENPKLELRVYKPSIKDKEDMIEKKDESEVIFSLKGDMIE